MAVGPAEGSGGLGTTPAEGGAELVAAPWGGRGLSGMGDILQERRCRREVSRRGDLQGPRIAVDHPDLSPGQLDETGVVSGRGPAGVGALEHPTQKPLRSLYAAQRVTRGSRQDQALRVDHLDGVGDSQTRDHCGAARTNRVDHAGEEVGGGQTTSGVVHQDDAVIGADRGEPGLDRCRPVGTPGDDTDPRVLTGEVTSLLAVGSGSDDHDVSHLGAAQNAPQRVSQQWLAAQRGECFGHADTKAHTVSGGDKNDHDIHAAITFTVLSHSQWYHVQQVPLIERDTCWNTIEREA